MPGDVVGNPRIAAGADSGGGSHAEGLPAHCGQRTHQQQAGPAEQSLLRALGEAEGWHQDQQHHGADPLPATRLRAHIPLLQGEGRDRGAPPPPLPTEAPPLEAQGHAGAGALLAAAEPMPAVAPPHAARAALVHGASHCGRAEP